MHVKFLIRTCELFNCACLAVHVMTAGELFNNVYIQHFQLAIAIHVYFMIVCSVRNKDQKLVGCFLENQTFCRFLIAGPLKMYSKFG